MGGWRASLIVLAGQQRKSLSYGGLSALTYVSKRVPRSERMRLHEQICPSAPCGADDLQKRRSSSGGDFPRTCKPNCGISHRILDTNNPSFVTRPSYHRGYRSP